MSFCSVFTLIIELCKSFNIITVLIYSLKSGVIILKPSPVRYIKQWVYFMKGNINMTNELSKG